jgi:hypothetical protein
MRGNSLWMEMCGIMLKSGIKLEVIRGFWTSANMVYDRGDILELIEPTNL